MHAILIATIALVGLPILLHLIMKQEPKRLPFPALRFLLQKKKINQRKMRLRHLLLLLMRILLIALFGLALFQPTLFSETLNFSAEQPVAAVFIVDTSPSMGYTANGRTRLEEARRRALELLDELPSGSRVAVLDPAEPGGQWEQTLGEARQKLDDLKEPRGAAVPVTAALATAYQLLRTVDQETEAPEPLPRLVAVFSDRTAACWDATRNDDLTKLRETIPPPAVAHLFVDVGVEQPADVAITSVDIKPQIIPQNRPVVFTATVRATGPAVPDMIVAARVTTANVPEQKQPVDLPAGTPKGVTFKFDGLPPGLHQAEITLDRDRKDALLHNNIRYITFRVAEPRTILTISDDTADAELWALAHEAMGEFVCELKRPGEVGDLAKYEAVCLLNVSNPANDRLWEKLESYVVAGGKLLIMPGVDVSREYDPLVNPNANRLMPGKLGNVIDTRDDLPKPADPKVHREQGVPWLIDDAAMRHPMLAKFREWKLADYDVVRNPRVAWKYYATDKEKQDNVTVIVYYDDADDPKDRHPAVLERAVQKGKIVLLTTRMDNPQQDQKWNSYWDTVGSSWYVVFPNLLLRYLAGDPDDANFNFATGQSVPVPLPKGGEKPPRLRVEGPGVSGRDAILELAARQSEVRLPPSKTHTAGNFHLATEDSKWKEGFSLNPPADEAVLDRVPTEAIEGLFGPDTVVPVGKDLKLRDAIASKYNQPVDLFPWLLIAVLLLIAAEGVVANRFYRVKA